MQHSRENEKTRQSASKGVKKVSISKAQASTRPITKESNPSPEVEPAHPSMGPVLTQEEYRSRVARKAFELYEKRQALTEVDDWVEAERQVKLDLLNGQRGASV